ncbi:MAG: hypothetical protein K2L79_04385 [Bacteroidales bacterium]|nr:hypothetical protein [Bacteroidales bacterium]
MIRFIKTLIKLLIVGIFVPRVGDTLLKGMVKIFFAIALILAIALNSCA